MKDHATELGTRFLVRLLPPSALLAVLLGVWALDGGHPGRVVACLSLAGVVAVTAAALWFRQLRPASWILVCGGLLVATELGLTVAAHQVASILAALPVLAFAAGLLLGPRPALLVGALSSVVATVVYATSVFSVSDDMSASVPAWLLIASIPMVVGFLVYRFAGQREAERALVDARSADIERLATLTDQIAKGNLAVPLDGSDAGQAALQKIVAGLTSVVLQIQMTAARVTSASGRINRSVRRSQKSLASQGGAVEETRVRLEELARLATDIARATEAVHQNATGVLDAQEQATDHTRRLSAQLGRMEDVLQQVRDIGRKSEMLALNASMEGLRVKGHGAFSQIAEEMARLTESSMTAVDDIKRLTRQISVLGEDTLAATANVAELAASSAREAERIRATTQEQESSISEVVEAMGSFDLLTQEANAAGEQTRAASESLVELAGRLDGLVARFQV